MTPSSAGVMHATALAGADKVALSGILTVAKSWLLHWRMCEMRLFQHVCGAVLAIVGFMLCVTTFSVRADIRVSQNVTETSGKATRAGTRKIEIKGLKMR